MFAVVGCEMTVENKEKLTKEKSKANPERQTEKAILGPIEIYSRPISEQTFKRKCIYFYVILFSFRPFLWPGRFSFASFRTMDFLMALVQM